MKDKGINVLSLFDGMSCGQIALKDLGIKVNNYFASEIDKHAIAQTQLNFPHTIQIGDVNFVHGDNLPKIDLVLAGSPCQGFSFAGKQLNFNDPRSRLFFEFDRILKEVRAKNPSVKFLLENVRMKKESERVISDTLSIQPVVINSSLVSAQNRHRLYWSNIRTRAEGLFGDLHTNIPQPKDRGLVLMDIAEEEVDKKYFLSDAAVKRLLNVDNDGFKSKIKSLSEKASCVFASQYKLARGMDLICVAMRGRNPENPSDRTTGAPTQQRLEAKTDGKTNCLTTVGKDNLVLGCDIREKRVRVRDNGKTGTLLARARTDESCGQLAVDIKNFTLRRLTPTECARLQTIPEWYKWECSSTQQYKMLGNGWTVEVIKHIFKYLEL